MVAGTTEMAPNRLRQEIDLKINLTRLRDLYSIFTFALSKEINQGCIPYIRSQWTTLWYILKGVPISCNLGYTSDEDITQISTYIHFVLQFLDDLLSDGIVEHESRLSILLRGECVQSSDKLNAVQREYAKLTTLTDLIYWRYKLAATDSDKSSFDILHKLSDEVLSKFIRFNLGFLRDRQLVENISQLILCAGWIFPQDSSIQDEAPPSNDFGDEHLVAAQRAKEFSARSTQLFHLLSQSIGRCGIEHIANLHLSGFGVKDPEMDMLLSTCSKQSLGGGWYPAELQKQNLPHSQQARLVDICQHLEESILHQVPIHIHYDGQNIWKGRIVPIRRQRRRKHNLTLSYRTLHDFFQQGPDENTDFRRRCRLQEQDRWRLECLLAQSLLYLFQSPWLPKAWDLCAIKFAQDDSSCNTAKPYASCTLRQSFSQEQEAKNDSHNYLEASDRMVEFGFLLLQIELGGELKLTEKERDDEYGIDAAIERHIDERKGDIKDPLKRVLKACLEFHEHVNETDSTIADDDLISRLVILKHILSPLKELLEMNYATVAKDIPDLILSASTEQVLGHKENLTIPTRSQDLERSRSPPIAPGLPNTAFLGFVSVTPSPQLQGFAMAQQTQLVSRNAIKAKMTSCVGVHQHTTVSSPTPPKSLVLFDENDHTSDLSDGKFNYALNFFQLYDAFHARYMMPQRIRRRIKIAVLDTGIDINQPSICGHLDLINMARWELNRGKMDSPIKARESFVGGPPVDECGHGTRVAELLLKVAPYADLYVGKISNGMKDGDAGSASHVAEAINWAVKQNVDIITMSFGLSGWDSQVNNAIQEATKHAVLFAAASNGGGNGRRTFPATHSGVFCIHASDGNGNDYSGMNPSTESFSDSWTTLGVAIPFDDQSICKSGTSYATPIASGTIANVFDYLNYLREQGKLPDQKYYHLRSSDGVDRILWHMSNERQGFRYVAPWNLWDCHCKDSEENVGQSQEYVRLKLLKETG